MCSDSSPPPSPHRPPNGDPPPVLLRTPRFWIEEVSRRLPDGRIITREIIRHRGSVVIVPLLANGDVCLIRNERWALGETLIELPAGTREAGEPPEVTAERELAEETGWRAGTIRFVRAFLPAPGLMDEEMRLYVAEQLTPGAVGREPGEEIENLIVPSQEALAMIDRGEIRDAKTIIGLWSVLT